MFLPVWGLYLLPEREPLVTCKSRRHLKTFCCQLPWNEQLYKSPYRIGRRPGYQGSRCSISSSVDSGQSARKKKKTTIDNCPMVLQDSPRPISSWPTRKTYSTSSNGTCKNTASTSPPNVKQGSQSLVVSTTWNTLSSRVANPKQKEGRSAWALLSKRTSSERWQKCHGQ